MALQDELMLKSQLLAYEHVIHGKDFWWLHPNFKEAFYEWNVLHEKSNALSLLKEQKTNFS